MVRASTRSTPGRPRRPAQRVAAREHDPQGPFGPRRRRRPRRGRSAGPAPSRSSARVSPGDRQASRRAARAPDGDAGRPRQQLAGLGDGGSVAGGRTTTGTPKQPATAAFRRALAGLDHVVDAYAEDPEVYDVVEYRAGGAGAGVVADEQGGVEALVDAAIMPSGEGEPFTRRTVAGRPAGEKVGAAVVGVADDDLDGARRRGILRSRHRIGSHEPASACPGRESRFRSDLR